VPGAAAHEMHSVITALKADSIALAARRQDGTLDSAFGARKVTKILGRVEFLERLVRDMRAYAQPVPDERIAVPVADLVTEARSIVHQNLLARGMDPGQVQLSVHVPERLELKVSRYHLVGALVNVLTNAYEALPTVDHALDGAIRITAAVAGGGTQVQIEVQDTGVGIRADELEEIRQCLPGRTSKRRQGNTGFGLCRVRRCLEAHGGRVRIDSEEDVGTTVTLTLPLGPGEPQP
jgi:signal transduction histidine kinase